MILPNSKETFLGKELVSTQIRRHTSSTRTLEAEEQTLEREGLPVGKALADRCGLIHVFQQRPDSEV